MEGSGSILKLTRIYGFSYFESTAWNKKRYIPIRSISAFFIEVHKVCTHSSAAPKYACQVNAVKRILWIWLFSSLVSFANNKWQEKKILSYWPAWKTNTWISFIFKSSKIFQLQIAVTIAVIIRVILHMAFSLLLEEMYFPIYVCCEKVFRMTACMLNLVFIKCQLES